MPYYHYFVEGECEEKLINAYKVPPYAKFKPGKVEVYNFVMKRITNQRLLALNKKTIIILVYDTDVEKTDILEENIRKLREFEFKVYHVQSIKTFEDELIYSSNLKSVNSLFGTKGKAEFKAHFIRQDNLPSRLNKIDFRIDKMWSRVNDRPPFDKFFSSEALKFIKSTKE